MVSLLPYLTWQILARGEGESALDQLGAAFDGDVLRRGEQDVNVVGHYDEGMKLELSRVAIAEEYGDKEFGDRVALKDAAALVGDGGEHVGLGFEAHDGRACPRG